MGSAAIPNTIAVVKECSGTRNDCFPFRHTIAKIGPCFGNESDVHAPRLHPVVADDLHHWPAGPIQQYPRRNRRLKNLSRPKVELAQFGVLRIDARKFVRMGRLYRSHALMDKLQIIERYNHRTKRCCVLSQDDGTGSVIVVRSSVQKPATSARRDSARIDRPATVGIILAPCRTPAAAAPKQPFRPDRRPAIPAIPAIIATEPRSQPFWCVGSGKRFLPLGARTGETVLRP